MKPHRSRLVRVIVAAFALPVLMGAGTCGILFDLWSWDEITERSDSVHVDVDEGALEVVGYERTNVWIQRHVYAFEGSLGKVDYSVNDDYVFEVVFDCDGPATCFADHWLEVPIAMPMDVRIGKGAMQFFSVQGDLSLSLDEGPVAGGDLGPGAFVLRGGAVPLDLTWVSVPASVDIELEESDVVLNLPAGTYACDLPSGATVAEEIVCDEASEFPLRVALEEGTVVVDAVAAD